MGTKLVAGESASKKPEREKTAKSEGPDCCNPDEPRSFNETTIKAIEDTRAGRNLTEFADEDELFQKLGIKVGKEKT